MILDTVPGKIIKKAARLSFDVDHASSSSLHQTKFEMQGEAAGKHFTFNPTAL